MFYEIKTFHFQIFSSILLIVVLTLFICYSFASLAKQKVEKKSENLTIKTVMFVCKHVRRQNTLCIAFNVFVFDSLFSYFFRTLFSCFLWHFVRFHSRALNANESVATPHSLSFILFSVCVNIRFLPFISSLDIERLFTFRRR